MNEIRQSIAPCSDCGARTETVPAGAGRCGPCQYPIDRPRPPFTPLRVHRSGRLVPACRRCRHNRPALGDPLGWCARCADPYPPELPATPTPTTARPGCVECGRPLLLIRPGRDTCERCRLGRTQPPPAPSPTTTTTLPSTCAGCGQQRYGVADGHCMSCRHLLGLVAYTCDDTCDHCTSAHPRQEQESPRAGVTAGGRNTEKEHS